MKTYRPLWEDGAALAPQQFQQQARWSVHVADIVARMGISHPWGVIAAEFDDTALALSRLNATCLVVRFQDGTLVDTGLADNLPPVCDLSSAAGSEAVEVVAALPLLSASGGNLDNGQDSERPRRWKAERVVVQELAGYESRELAILRNALTLRLSSQENTAYLTYPVARLVRNAQGLWSRDLVKIEAGGIGYSTPHSYTRNIKRTLKLRSGSSPVSLAEMPPESTVLSRSATKSCFRGMDALTGAEDMEFAYQLSMLTGAIQSSTNSSLTHAVNTDSEEPVALDYVFQIRAGTR